MSCLEIYPAISRSSSGFKAPRKGGMFWFLPFIAVSKIVFMSLEAVAAKPRVSMTRHAEPAI